MKPRPDTSAYDRARYVADIGRRREMGRAYYREKRPKVFNERPPGSPRAEWRARNWQKEATWRLISKAKRSGRPYDREYLMALVCPVNCPIFGTPISFGPKGEGRDQQNVASFDRIDNERGYVDGNVQIISLRANKFKGWATVDDLRSFGEWVRRTLGN